MRDPDWGGTFMDAICTPVYLDTILPSFEIYSGGNCPFHPHQPMTASPYHCTCKCPANAIKRNMRLQKCLDSINSNLDLFYDKFNTFEEGQEKPFISFNLLRTLLTPNYEGLHKFGKPPAALESWVVENAGEKIKDKMCSVVYKAVTTFYMECWKDYCDLLHRKKLNFASVLKEKYDILPCEIPEYRYRVENNGQEGAPSVIFQNSIEHVEP